MNCKVRASCKHRTSQLHRAWKFAKQANFAGRRGGTGLSVIAADLENLARLRHQAWANLGRWHQAWPTDAKIAAALTKELNGHSCDLVRGSKSSYFGDAGGLYGARRYARFLAEPGGVHPEPDPSPETAYEMRTNGHIGGGGRSKAWSIKGDDIIVKWKKHDRPEISELLASGWFRVVNPEAEGSGMGGGVHDLADLLYHRLNPRVPLVEHRIALTRPGRLPVAMRAAPDDAERIIRSMHEAGVPKAAIARLFKCSRRTIIRITPAESVTQIAHRGRDDFSLREAA